MTASLLWKVYALSCLVAVTAMLLQCRDSYYRTHRRWRDDPRALAAACLEAILIGLGIGVGSALVVLSAIVIVQGVTA